MAIHNLPEIHGYESFEKGSTRTLLCIMFNLRYCICSAAVTIAIACPLRVMAQAPGVTLPAAEQRLLARNRDILAARRAVETSQANTTTAAARPNPTLSFGMSSINPSVGIGSGPLRDKTVDSSVRVDQVLERGNRRDLRISLAKSLETASTEDLAEITRQQIVALRMAFYDLLLFQEKTAVTRDAADLFQRSVEAAEKRLNLGDIAASDVSRIRVDALRAASDARAAEADRRRAQVALAVLIGAEAEIATLRAADGWPGLLEGGPLQIDPEKLDTRPDVRAAHKRVEAALKARDLARSLRTRDVSVGAQYDRYPSNATNTFGTGNTYGVFVSIPLFVNYAYEGEIQRAEVDYTMAEEALERSRALARSDADRALADLQSEQERLRRSVLTLAEAGRAAQAAEFAYANGALGVMDMLDARRTLRALQVEAAQSRADHAKAFAAWNAASGEFSGTP